MVLESTGSLVVLIPLSYPKVEDSNPVVQKLNFLFEILMCFTDSTIISYTSRLTRDFFRLLMRHGQQRHLPVTFVFLN